MNKKDDYIRHPKSDGYRGVHLIYSHFSAAAPAYDGLKIEVQIRSQLQHIWATAVETVDIFLRLGLKSHRGTPEWTRFFALMGSAIAIREGCRPVKKTPRNETALVAEIKELAEKLDVLDRLAHFGNSLRRIESLNMPRRGIHYLVLELDVNGDAVRIYGFAPNQSEQAMSFYLDRERNKPNDGDVVLAGC